MLQLRTYLSLKEINDVLLYLAQRKFSKKLFIVIEFIEAIIYIITWLFRVIMEHVSWATHYSKCFPISHTISHTSNSSEYYFFTCFTGEETKKHGS